MTLQAGSNTVSLGTSTALSNSSGNLAITGAGTLTLKSTTGSAITLDSGTNGTVNVGTGSSNGKTIQVGAISGGITDTINIGNNATASSVNNVTIGSTLGASSVKIQGGTGGIILKSGATATTALQIQNSSATVLLDTDTTNSRIGVDNSAPAYSLDVTGDINASSTLKVGGVTVCTSAGCTGATTSGSFINNGTVAQSADFYIQSTALGQVAATIQGNTSSPSSDTANLLNVEDGSANKVLTVGPNGAVTLNPSVTTSSASSTALTVQASTGNDTSTVGSNLITTTDFCNAAWTTTGWTLSPICSSPPATTATNTSSNVSPLTTTQVTPSAGQVYEVTYTLAGTPASASTLSVKLGGTTAASYTFNGSSSWNFTDTKLVTATGSGVLTFTPSGTYTGTISNISVELVTQNTTPTLVVKNASGTANIEVRSSSDTSNTFVGLSAGMSDSPSGGGIQNTALGSQALQNNTTGSALTAVGYLALQSNTTGIDNTAIGQRALTLVTSGSSNTAVGYETLQSLLGATNNTAVGSQALQNDVTGGSNTALGFGA